MLRIAGSVPGTRGGVGDAEYQRDLKCSWIDVPLFTWTILGRKEPPRARRGGAVRGEEVCGRALGPPHVQRREGTIHNLHVPGDEMASHEHGIERRKIEFLHQAKAADLMRLRKWLAGDPRGADRLRVTPGPEVIRDILGIKGADGAAKALCVSSQLGPQHRHAGGKGG